MAGDPIYFASSAELRAWLAENHATQSELLVGFHKAHTGRPTLTWEESVREALCFGWIDGQVRRVDDDRYTRRFTPRKPDSIWSSVNVALMAELEAAGLVEEAGRAAFARRREDRTGVYAHERKRPARLGRADSAALKAVPGAWEYFSAQAPSYRRAVAHWLTSAKRPETRERRLAQLIEDSAAGRWIKPMRWGRSKGGSSR